MFFDGVRESWTIGARLTQWYRNECESRIYKDFRDFYKPAIDAMKEHEKRPDFSSSLLVIYAIRMYKKTIGYTKDMKLSFCKGFG